MEVRIPRVLILGTPPLFLVTLPGPWNFIIAILDHPRVIFARRPSLGYAVTFKRHCQRHVRAALPWKLQYPPEPLCSKQPYRKE